MYVFTYTYYYNLTFSSPIEIRKLYTGYLFTKDYALKITYNMRTKSYI